MDIALNNVYKSFGQRILFENVTLSFPENRISCISGPSGCGKTTLFNLLMGLEKADSGAIEGLSNQRISAVFQEDRLCENLSTLSNASIALGKGKTKETALAMLEALGLGDAAHQPVKSLSGGMKRRTALARALLADYDLLLLDEPFTGLDEESLKLAVRCILSSLNGRTAIIVSHDSRISELMGGKTYFLPDYLNIHNC